MVNSLDEKHNETGTNFAVQDVASRAAQDADDFGPEDAALYYDEGHSGWNR